MRRPSVRRDRVRWWLPFSIGAIALVVFESFLAHDVIASHRGPVHSDAQIIELLRQPARTNLDRVARLIAINFTALAWPAYLLMLVGVLERQTRERFIRPRRHHLAMLALASIVIWCVFDAINFRGGMRAWIYIGIPHHFSDRILGYLFAFATIAPGMLMTAQAVLHSELLAKFRARTWKLSGAGWWLIVSTGLAMTIWPLLDTRPITNLTLWTSLVFFLDPINLQLNRPSLLRDWQNGWYGRTVALFAGGLICGLLWEFWNYWALAKWVYHLPFLGSLEQVRYFEMPVIGLIGFIPFGAECWVMWQTIRIPLDGLVEPLRSEMDVI